MTARQQRLIRYCIVRLSSYCDFPFPGYPPEFLEFHKHLLTCLQAVIKNRPDDPIPVHYGKDENFKRFFECR